MITRSLLGLVGLSSFLLASGCIAENPSSERSGGRAELPIFNGTIDNQDPQHDAVVAVLSATSECTGTLIKKDVANKKGYVLTAAHCMQEAPEVVVRGLDYSSGGVSYPVVDYKADSAYDGQKFDFAMVTFQWGGGQAEPPQVIPAMTTVQDDLIVGSTVDFVGYGKTESNANNSKRYHVEGMLDMVSTYTVHYNQSNMGPFANDSGPCSGDSGGPAIYNVPGVGEVVAAVTSYGDAQCTKEGTSSRVSTAEQFIADYIANGGGGAQTCDQCAQSSTSQGGACENAWNACTNDADCVALVQCLNNCGPQSCVDACVQNNPNGVDLYSATLQCICDSGCPSECANAAFCQSQPMGCGFTADAACQTCFEGSCCDEATSCSNDAACVDCLTNANADPSCFDTNANAGAFLGCLQQNCSSECGVGGGGVGGGGIGGGSAGGTGGTGGALLAGGTGGGGTGGAGGSPAGGGPSANGGNGGSGTSTTTITCGACRTGTGSTDSDGAAAVLGAALLGLFAARRRRDPR